MRRLWLAIATFNSMATVYAADLSWDIFNRAIAVQVYANQQEYIELDNQGKTTDGVFDAENGVWNGLAVQLRWQGTLVDFPLWLQLHIGEVQGKTQYTGYLQTGSQLIPFQSKTGNVYRREYFRIGVPWVIKKIPIQVIPYFELLKERWLRNLVQYSETYTYATQSVGLLTQWRLNPKWVFELGYQQGQQLVHLSVPGLEFEADQGNGSPAQTSLALHYQMSERLGLQLQASQTQYNNGQSAVVNGYQAPPSTTQHTRLGVALDWHY